jgi:hypothetical protein
VLARAARIPPVSRRERGPGSRRSTVRRTGSAALRRRRQRRSLQRHARGRPRAGRWGPRDRAGLTNPTTRRSSRSYTCANAGVKGPWLASQSAIPQGAALVGPPSKPGRSDGLTLATGPSQKPEGRVSQPEHLPDCRVGHWSTSASSASSSGPSPTMCGRSRWRTGEAFSGREFSARTRRSTGGDATP